VVYKFAGTMIGLTLLGLTANSLAPFLLGICLNASDVGIYSIALTMASIMTMAQSSINSVFAPHIPELYSAGSTADLVEIYYRVTRCNLAVAFPLFVIFLLLPRDIMAIFGSEFVKGAPMLAVLAIGGIIDLGSGPVVSLLKFTGHERSLFWGDAGKVFTVSVTLLLFLPIFGLLGAAIAWCITTTCFFLVYYFYAKRFFPIYFLNHATWKMLISAVGFLLFSWALLSLLKTYLAPLLLLITAFSLLYLLWGAWLFGGLLDENDKKFVSEAVAGILSDFLRRRWSLCATPKGN
jgi:O-antigen/teichoic acid export membrane protein